MRWSIVCTRKREEGLGISTLNKTLLGKWRKKFGEEIWALRRKQVILGKYRAACGADAPVRQTDGRFGIDVGKRWVGIHEILFIVSEKQKKKKKKKVIKYYQTCES